MAQAIGELVWWGLMASLAACSSGSSEPASPSAPAPAQPPSTEEAPAQEHGAEEGDPAAPLEFERILVVMDESPCPPQGHGDCASRFELLADGTVRIDPWGEPGESFEGTVSSDVVREAVATFTRSELTSLLDGGCSGSHPSEDVLVRVAGRDYQAETGHCNEDAIQSMRRAMFDVARAAYPGHSLISPPF